MKVIATQQAVRFTTGDALSPSDLNDVFLYAKDALADVTEKRFALTPILFPYNAGLSNASSVERRSHRFVCPMACTIVRAFLDANITAASAVTVQIQQAVTSAIPTGATTPYLNIAAGATTADDVEDTNIQSVTLDAGVVYDIVVSGASFTVDRLNIVLHVQVDRWRAFGTLDVPSFAFEDFADGLADATLVSGAIGQLAAAVAGLSVARGMGPALHVEDTFNNATLSNELLRVLPVSSATRCTSRIVRAYLSSVTLGTGQVVTALLRNAAGFTVATLSNNHAVDLIMTADSGVLALTLNGGVDLLTEDFTVEFSASTAQTVLRATLLLWLEW